MTIRCHTMTTWWKTDDNRKYHVLILGYPKYFKKLYYIKNGFSSILVLHESKKEYGECLEMPHKHAYVMTLWFCWKCPQIRRAHHRWIKKDHLWICKSVRDFWSGQWPVKNLLFTADGGFRAFDARSVSAFYPFPSFVTSFLIWSS